MKLVAMLKILPQMVALSLHVRAHQPLLWEQPLPALTPPERSQTDLPLLIVVLLQTSNPKDSIPVVLVQCVFAAAMEAEEPREH